MKEDYKFTLVKRNVILLFIQVLDKCQKHDRYYDLCTTLCRRDWHPECRGTAALLRFFCVQSTALSYDGLDGAVARLAGCDPSMPTLFSPSPNDWHRLETGL